MTDAPETIWARSEKGERGDRCLFGVFRTTKIANPDWYDRNNYHEQVEYRRADLPPTSAQIMADPRVQALVRETYLEGFEDGKIENIAEQVRLWNTQTAEEAWKTSEALAALEKP